MVTLFSVASSGYLIEINRHLNVSGEIIQGRKILQTLFLSLYNHSIAPKELSHVKITRGNSFKLIVPNS